MRTCISSVVIFTAAVAGAQPTGSQEPSAFNPPVDPVTDWGLCTPKVEYDVEQALVGKDIRVKILVDCVGPQVRIERIEAANPDAITVTSMSANPQPQAIAGGGTRLQYLYRIGISDDAEPRTYNVEMKMRPAGSAAPYAIRDFDLDVGVRQRGRLRIDSESHGTCVMGRKSAFTLMLVNEYRDYTVLVHEITATSTSGDLVPNQTTGLQPPLAIAPGQRVSKTIELDIAGITMTRLLAGISGKQQFEFTIAYADIRGRRVSDLTQLVNIEAKPTFWNWAIAMLAGVAAGTAIKFCRQPRSRTAPKKLAAAVTGTVLLGILVSVITLLGDVRITGFNLHGSNDSLMVVLVIGLIAGLGGAQFIDALIRRLQPAPERAVATGA